MIRHICIPWKALFRMPNSKLDSNSSNDNNNSNSKESRIWLRCKRRLRNSLKNRDKCKKSLKLITNKSSKKDQKNLPKHSFQSKSSYQPQYSSPTNPYQTKISPSKKRWFHSKKATSNNNKNLFSTSKPHSHSSFPKPLKTRHKSFQPTPNSNLTLKSSQSSFQD
jgi:hypothetical protein